MVKFLTFKSNLHEGEKPKSYSSPIERYIHHIRNGSDFHSCPDNRNL